MLFLTKWSFSQSLDSIYDALNLHEVVVSGTRYYYDRSEAPVLVDLLSSKHLKASQSISLADGLSFVPGVRVETNCQNCGFTQVRLNGLAGSYSQILVNNRPVFSALNSVYGLEQIPTNMIEQIEVIRGSGSALYGSNAIGGIINILTKDPQENSWEIKQNIALMAGQAVDQNTNFNTSWVSKNSVSGITLYGTQRSREAWDANGDGFTEKVELNSNVLGVKAYHKLSLQSKLTFDFSWVDEYRRGGDRMELEPHLTDITEELDHDIFLGGANVDFWSKDRRTSSSVYGSFSKTQRDSYYGGLGGGRTAEDSTMASNAYGVTGDFSAVIGGLTTHHITDEQTFVFGGEWQWNETLDQIDGYQRSIVQSVNAYGVFAQHEWKPTKKFKSILGARYDRVAVQGQYLLASIARSSEINLGVLSPRATFMYKLSSLTRFRGGYARGFRAPQTFNEDLHISFAGGEPLFAILSNELAHETSNAFNVSWNHTATYFGGQTSLLFQAFYTQLNNPFISVSTGSTLPNGSIVEEIRNGSGAQVQGLNYEAGWAPSPFFTLQLGGTIQSSLYDEFQILFEPDGIPNPGEGIVVTNRFLRTPNSYGYFNIYYSHQPEISMDFTGTYTGSMLVPLIISDSGFMELRNSNSFLDVNLKLNYSKDLSKKLNLETSLGVKNLFNSFQNDFESGADRDASYIYGPSLPRTYFLSLTLRNSY